MIAQSEIWKLIANAIEKNDVVRGIFARYENQCRIHVGHQAAQELNQATCPMISVSPMDAPMDAGHFAKEREVAVMIRFAVNDDLAEDDGVRVTYRGVIELDELGHGIVAAIKEIECLGDDLAEAKMYLDSTETFPLCQGRIECLFKLTRGLAYEPEITEIENGE